MVSAVVTFMDPKELIVAAEENEDGLDLADLIDEAQENDRSNEDYRDSQDY